MWYSIYMKLKALTLPRTTQQVMEYSLLAASFFIPFLISGPQLLTGAIVNTLLFLFVAQAYSKKTLPIVMFPSIGAVLNGLIFGKFTIFLLYFLPFIWVGNYILIESFRYLRKNTSFFVSILGSSFLKSGVLFLVAFLLTSAKIVPLIFLQLMGMFQLVTAIAGGIIALAIHTFISKKI